MHDILSPKGMCCESRDLFRFFGTGHINALVHGAR